ncbi:hypothetical protein PSDVSF_16030 [Pseudodesulfovibrio sediminis]|uniref:Solute-binding protein family 3/N-terminal domain-containing protein n=2 Tax=Pseudodesulfovibrio sediminis TaxID=2810563 RepID=A0ABM7P676_9BACT|nr:hypothetical protein PSDVSF_16030 [Pseudodesulfovibrio sediminis]
MPGSCCRFFCAIGASFFVILLLAEYVFAGADYTETGITIAATANWRPYSFKGSDGRPAGFLVDYWEKWSEKTGVPVSFKLAEWNDSLRLVINGECDLHCGLYATDERAKIFAFTGPVYQGSSVIVVRSGVSCESDLPSLRWGGVTGTVDIDYARNYSVAGEVTPFSCSTSLLKALDAGTIQAAIDDMSAVVLIGRDLGVENAFNICETVYVGDLLGGVQKERTDLMELVKLGMARVSASERRAIVNKWFIDQEIQTGWWQGHVVLGGASLVGGLIVLLLTTGRSRKKRRTLSDKN